MTLPRLLEESAGSPSPITIVGKDRRASRLRADLLEDGRRVAGGLTSAGFGGGDRIALAAATTFEFIVSSLGIWTAGGVVVPLPPPVPGRRRPGPALGPDRFLKAAGVKAVVVSDDGGEVPTSLTTFGYEDLRSHSPTEGLDPAPEDEALIQSSSGSTGMAKGVVLTHRALAGHVKTLATLLEPYGGRSDPFVSWLPLHHDLGFVHYLLHPFVTPVPLLLMSPGHFLRDPLSWLHEIASIRGGLSAAPNFAYGLVARSLERWTGEHLDLSCWRVAGIGGEPLDAVVLERFARAAEPHGFDRRSLSAGYGLAEATCAATERLGEGLLLDHVDRAALSEGRAEAVRAGEGSAVFVSVGRSIPGSQVRIVDASGTVMPERHLGEIQVKSPFLMKGYVAAEGIARDGTRVDEEGWLSTGDRGYMVGGELFVTGRIKDLIIVYGRNHHAEEIEWVASRVPGVRPGGCAAFAVEGITGADRLVVVAETALAAPVEVEELRSAVRHRVRSEIGLVAGDIVIVPPGSIPKTTSGKIQRGRARGLYAEGRWQPATADRQASL